ncbi:hypothetical protein EGJ51_17800 [Pseudomonas fulva]|uniref:Uncharacterized protein n=1 Tax=Pseudomonas parafulva TaxID=157782 RepID=A0AAJ0LIQ4_9PSED|nr:MULTISPECIES: hypothetical protein [Pseudomonas]KTT16897.1 hypothetical protein NS96R_14195 [Pseudomonas parafulva]MBA1218213.1 hypothetical protein [Pseudomonas fulva]RRW59493.1 hypothetical protein EGJ51_17800 [Pseudomonas fulva]
MANIFERMAYQAANKVIPKIGVSSKVLKYSSAARDILNGNLPSGTNRLLDAVYGRASGNIILAGLSWPQQIQMFEEASSIERERTNLFHIDIAPTGRINAPRVNLLATEASYNQTQLGWDSVKIGSGFSQAPTGAEATELRLVTYDVDGEIKQWFDQLKATVAHGDGTYGLPTEYCNTITVTHGAVLEGRGYAKSWVMVPGTCEVNLQRSTDDFTALNLTFIEFDYFGSL